MALPLPRSLSPSKLSAFKDCALAFRFSAIDHLPERSTPYQVLGTLVHRALERLFWEHPKGARTPQAAQAELANAWEELNNDEELISLGLDEPGAKSMLSAASQLVANEFLIEDPNSVEVIATELMIEARLERVLLRGIIDRLDRGPEGELIVVDYKTGRVPFAGKEQAKLAGVQFYAMLCEEVLGQRPSVIRLSYLAEPLLIDAIPTDQAMRGLRQRTAAVWKAIERACERDDFRPRPSALCKFCSFQSLCPAFGAAQSDQATTTVDSQAMPWDQGMVPVDVSLVPPDPSSLVHRGSRSQ